MNKLQSFIQTMPMGFMSSKDVAELIKIDRLFPVLVRCGGCRFTCAAQDVEHLLKCIVAGDDYVRDVSLPHGSAECAATWKESCPVTPLSLLPASFTATRPDVREDRRTGQYVPTVDGRDVSPTSFDKGRALDIARQSCRFNESDCGGVYDGLGTVTSDADPGL